MIFKLFLNACILISFISVSYIHFKSKDISNNISLGLKIIIGLASGALGIILIVYGVPVASDIVIDFRYIPVLLTAMYCGFLPTIISCTIIGIFQLFYSGISKISVIGLVATLIIGIGLGIITKAVSSRKRKWVCSIIFLFTVFSAAFFIALGTSILFFKTIIIYCTSNILISCIVFIYTEYLCGVIRSNKILKNEATKDYLTGLNNTREFEAYFKSISQLSLRKEEKLSFLFIDIDYFKKINDTYGHKAGNLILKGLADIFVNTVRCFDIVSRNGGEEFSILLLDCSADHAVSIAERLRKKVEAHNFNISEKLCINITISIGVSTYPTTTNNIDKLFEDADKALYEAKETGRNKVVLYK